MRQQDTFEQEHIRIAELFGLNGGFDAPEKDGYWTGDRGRVPATVEFIPTAEYRVWKNLQYYLDVVDEEAFVPPTQEELLYQYADSIGETVDFIRELKYAAKLSRFKKEKPDLFRQLSS